MGAAISNATVQIKWPLASLLDAASACVEGSLRRCRICRNCESDFFSFSSNVLLVYFFYFIFIFHMLRSAPEGNDSSCGFKKTTEVQVLDIALVHRHTAACMRAFPSIHSLSLSLCIRIFICTCGSVWDVCLSLSLRVCASPPVPVPLSSTLQREEKEKKCKAIRSTT